jgi:hypothetical protein
MVEFMSSYLCLKNKNMIGSWCAIQKSTIADSPSIEHDPDQNWF